MSDWQTFALWSYSALVLITMLRHLLLSRAMPQIPVLRRSGAGVERSTAPLVSILVPAKDEEAGIERCLTSLLAQDYPRFEVLVVDDRSEDRTAEIVRDWASRDDRLRLECVRSLPAGWTGKTHALDQLQRSAKGDWLLFVDADVTLDPRCLSVTVREAIDRDARLLSLLPALESGSFWETVVQPFAGICLMILYPLPRVNDPSEKRMGFANGQFILIRRDAYDAIDGHRAVRDKFVEDIHLGRNVRQKGLGLRVAMAPELAKVRMYASLEGIVRGWSRILYSAVDHRMAPLFGLLAAILVFSVTPYLVFVVSVVNLILRNAIGYHGWMLSLAIVHEIAQATIMARIYALSDSHRPKALLFRILGVAVMIHVVLRTIRMCRTHRVQWRGDAYGSELRASS